MPNVYTLQTNNDIETDKKIIFIIWLLKYGNWKNGIKLIFILVWLNVFLKKFSTTFKTILPLLLLFEVQKNKESKNPRFSNTINGRTVLFSKCAVYDHRKLRFVKKQESRGFLSKLRIRTSLSYSPILGD